MAMRYVRRVVLAAALLLPAAAWAAEGNLSAAYATILRGDYESGRAALAELLRSEGDQPAARRADEWLRAYHEVIANRKALKAASFEWNVSEAQKALAAGEPLLALGFAAQAVAYAADQQELGRQPWVQELAARVRAEAARREQANEWGNALGLYMALGRLYPDDAELKERREAAARQARLKVVYRNQKELKERIRDVDDSLLRAAVRMVERMYYREPDFRKMALGGLDAVLTVAESQKLREYLDGLANTALREHFTARLRELRKAVTSAASYDYQDLLRLFRSVQGANKGSVEVPDALLVVEFTDGMLGALDDYTSMIWPADVKEFDKQMMGGFEGIGIKLGVDERTGRLKVVSPLENSPALEAGIQPDDLIVAVNGESTRGWTTEDAVRNIMGPGGTEVVVTICRPSTGEEIPFRLIRRRIELTSVRGLARSNTSPDGWDYMLDRDNGVAYIRLSNFQPKSQLELRRALQQAAAQGMRGLVLDLRHNPGGLLDVAVDIVSTFVAEGQVVSTRGRLEPEHQERVTGEVAYRDLPLVVLVNEASASASEILAGALQDHHRAIVLGERTFGKGSVQNVRGLRDKNDVRLKLTTALYYLPSGRTPHKASDAEKWGIDPDWEIKLTPKEFRRVLERERDSDVIHNEKATSANQRLSDEEREKYLERLKDDGRQEEDEPPLYTEDQLKRLDSDPNKAPNVDPQLETALLLVRVKLAAQVPWPKDLAAALSRDQARP